MWFSNVNFADIQQRSEGAGQAKLLAPGKYSAQLLRLDEGQRPAFQRTAGQPEQVPCLSFVFACQGAWLFRTVNLTASPRSNLFRLVSQMSGGTIPKKALSSGEAFEAHIRSLVGQSFCVDVAPSPNGKWNNVLGASPL